MSDDLEILLRRFRPDGPPVSLREKILRQEIPPAAVVRHWPIRLFRGAIAALLVVSFSLFYAADRLNQDTATHVGVGPVRWTADAQQAADLLGPGPASRRYIEICLIASHGRALSQSKFTAGEFR